MHKSSTTINQIVFGSSTTALGTFGAVLTPHGLAYLTFASDVLANCALWIAQRLPHAHVIHDASRLQAISTQLDAYCAGAMQPVTIPLDLRGTPFQVQVWQALQQIPYGSVQTYRQLAIALGRPQAARAVGAAIGANPVAIFVPCHRVMASTGKLISYRGGLAMKQRLLQLEGILEVGETALPAHRAPLSCPNTTLQPPG